VALHRSGVHFSFPFTHIIGVFYDTRWLWTNLDKCDSEMKLNVMESSIRDVIWLETDAQIKEPDDRSEGG